MTVLALCHAELLKICVLYNNFHIYMQVEYNMTDPKCTSPNIPNLTLMTMWS